MIGIWDTASGRQLNPSADVKDVIWKVRFSPDGKWLAYVPMDDTVRLWDTKARKEVRRITVASYGWFLAAFSRDGKVLATKSTAFGFVLWDTETGKERKRFDDRKTSGEFIGFSPVADLMASQAGRDLVLWDLANDRELRRLKDVHGAALSPDGHTFAGFPSDRGFAFRDGRIVLCDIATGKIRHTLEKGQGASSPLAFAPDGWTLASAGGGQYKKDDLNPVDPAVILWECFTGKERLRLDGHPGQVESVAFSPDGRLLASTTWHDADVIRVWDAAGGKLLCRLDGHRGRVTSVAFAPDGKVLASASADTTVLLWDVAACIAGKGRRVEKRSPEQLTALAADLGSDDAAKAFRAIIALADHPEPVVGIVQKRLESAAAEEGRISRLVADLDAEEFAVREKATVELARLDQAAEMALREAEANAPSAEVRRRTKALLAKLKRSAIPSHVLVAVRSVEILERAATPDARRLLKQLTAGAPDARLTREAKAALERLANR